MAAETETIASPKDPAAPIGVWIGPVIAAGLIPGGGHFLQKRIGRGALILASVTLMFLFGMFMRGMMFTPEKGDILTTLINYGGFVCDLASGVFYFAAAMFGYAAPDMAGDVHDYGTK